MHEFLIIIREVYGEELSGITSKYVNTAKRIEKCKLGIDFIKDCLCHEKHPDFSRINLVNNQLNTNNKFINFIRNEITEEELQNKMKTKRKLENVIKELQINFSTSPPNIGICCKNKFNIRKIEFENNLKYYTTKNFKNLE